MYSTFTGICILGCTLPLIFAQKRLYYTGKFKNDQTNTVSFNGGKLLHSDLFEFSNLNEDWIPDFNSSFLYSGQTFLRLKHVNVTVDSELLGFITTEISDHETDIVHLKTASFYKQISSFEYGSAMTHEGQDSNEFLLEAEVGLYDHAQDVFLEKYWREISGGDLVAVKIISTHYQNVSINRIDTQDDLAPESDVALLSASTVTRTHRLVFSRDFMGRVSVLSHSWRETSSSHDEEKEKKEEEAESVVSDMVKDEPFSAPLRVMTYNLWHNNPPSWIYHDKRARWNRYEQRMSHFADVVVAADPDVLTLQEVRHDSGFTATSKRTAHWLDESGSKEDAGSQVEHLLSHLALARRRAAVKANTTLPSAGEGVGNYYQFVFQPAMSMLDRARLIYRNEEGLLILSKLPILDSDVLLLPRQIGEASDDHQRIVLRVKVALSGPEVSGSAPTVDIMTTHLSLSESARDLAAREIIRLATCSQPHVANTNRRSSGPSEFSLSPVQVLTGDFNAEPQENFIRHLLHKDSYAQPGCPESDDESVVDAAPFVDSWLDYYTRTGHTADSSDEFLTEVDVAGNIVQTRGANQASEAESSGHTFPSCNPIKRIDFVLVRNHTSSSSSSSSQSGSRRRAVTATIERSYITGQRPSADTEHLVGSREGLGMNDADSPVWASDHFAVVTDLRVHY